MVSPVMVTMTLICSGGLVAAPANTNRSIQGGRSVLTMPTDTGNLAAHSCNKEWRIELSNFVKRETGSAYEEQRKQREIDP